MTNSTESTSELTKYECECLDAKKFRVVFDGASTGNYIVEFCETCFHSDSLQFMISTEIIS